MTRRLLDWFLLAAALSGGVLALWTGIERGRLSAKYRHLTSLTGELPIADRSKVYVKSLDTGDPLHFAWRVYFPPTSRQLLVYRFGAGKYTCWPCPTYDSIARVRIRPDNRGAAQVYVQFGGISTQLDLGDKEIAELMRDRWDRLKIEQLGAPELAIMTPDQSHALLRATLPDDLQAESKRKLSTGNQKQFVPVLFEFDLTLPPVKP
jgi:hypothetical protein